VLSSFRVDETISNMTATTIRYDMNSNTNMHTCVFFYSGILSGKLMPSNYIVNITIDILLKSRGGGGDVYVCVRENVPIINTQP